MLPKTKSSLECSVVVLCCSTHISSYIDSANLNVALYMMKFKTVVRNRYSTHLPFRPSGNLGALRLGVVRSLGLTRL